MKQEPQSWRRKRFTGTIHRQSGSSPNRQRALLKSAGEPQGRFSSSRRDTPIFGEDMSEGATWSAWRDQEPMHNENKNAIDRIVQGTFRKLFRTVLPDRATLVRTSYDGDGQTARHPGNRAGLPGGSFHPAVLKLVENFRYSPFQQVRSSSTTTPSMRRGGSSLHFLGTNVHLP